MPCARITRHGARPPPSRAAHSCATPAMPIAARVKRKAAPVKGGTSRRPNLIASHVLPHTAPSISIKLTTTSTWGPRVLSAVELVVSTGASELARPVRLSRAFLGLSLIAQALLQHAHQIDHLAAVRDGLVRFDFAHWHNFMLLALTFEQRRELLGAGIDQGFGV